MNVIMKILAAIFDLGAVKAIKSRKATIATVAIGVVLAWCQQASEAGLDVWIVCAGAVGVSIITAAYVFTQGKVDQTEAEGMTRLHTHALTIKAVAAKEGEPIPDDAAPAKPKAKRKPKMHKSRGVAGTKVGAVLIMCGALGFIHCAEGNDDDVAVDENGEVIIGNAVACFADAVQRVPQLYGITTVPLLDGHGSVEENMRIIGKRCFLTRDHEGEESGGNQTCVRQPLPWEPLANSQCVLVVNGDQLGVDVHVDDDALCHYPLTETGVSLQPMPDGSPRTFHLTRNTMPCLVGDDGRTYPDCAAWMNENGTFDSVEAMDGWEICCNDPTIRAAQKPGTCYGAEIGG